MEFGADDGGEIVAAKRPRVGHRIAVALDKMIAEGEKIIARAAPRSQHLRDHDAFGEGRLHRQAADDLANRKSIVFEFA